MVRKGKRSRRGGKSRTTTQFPTLYEEVAGGLLVAGKDVSFTRQQLVVDNRSFYLAEITLETVACQSTGPSGGSAVYQMEVHGMTDKIAWTSGPHLVGRSVRVHRYKFDRTIVGVWPEQQDGTIVRMTANCQLKDDVGMFRYIIRFKFAAAPEPASVKCPALEYGISELPESNPWEV